MDSDGLIIPGRPARKPAPKRSSKVDLAELGDNIVEPIERYVGNTSLDVTADLVKRVLIRCSEGLNEESPLEIIKVREIGTHFKNARTRCWQVTVPYRCRDLMNNHATYPPGWTHRAYFSPREGNKRAKPDMGHYCDIVNRILQENESARAVAWM